MIRSCSCRGRSASTLRGPSRKQAKVSSCQVCGGRKLVDGGRGSQSKSMVSTVGMELTSVMNSDLTWKAVTKGNRSQTRRARKPPIKSIKESDDLIKDRNRVVDMPVSESEKLGVKILGRRFSDNIEHVPIKKRRFLFRSPSPPPRTHSPERLSSIAKHQDVSDENEDFSGISILAAAACSNSIECGAGKAEESSTAEESNNLQRGSSDVLPVIASCTTTISVNHPRIPNNGTDSAISFAPKKKTTASSETTNSAPNLATMDTNVAGEKNTKLLDSDDSGPIQLKSAINKGDRALRGSKVSLWDDRLHWDLNVIMDAWEEPCDDPNLESQGNAVCSLKCEKQETSVDQKTHSEPGEVTRVIERTMVSSGISVNAQTDVNSLADTTRTNDISRKGHSLDALTVTGRSTSLLEEQNSLAFGNPPNNVFELGRVTNIVNKEERIIVNVGTTVPPAVEHTKEPLTMVNASVTPNEFSSTPCVSDGTGEDGEILSSHDVVKEDACSGHSCHMEGDHVTDKPLSNECIDEVCPDDVVVQTVDGSDDARSGGSVSLKNPKVEKNHVSVLDASILKKGSSNSDVVDLSKLNNVVALQPSPEGEDLSTKECVTDEKVHDNSFHSAEGDNQNIGEMRSSVHIAPKELSHVSSREVSGVVDDRANIGKIALEEGTCDDNDCASTDLHCDHGHIHGIQKLSELQDGYDSQYEDGELRESVVHSWEEDVGDEGDAEHVDYGSDNRDAYSFDATADFSDSMPAQVDKRIDCRKERSAEFSYVDQVQEQCFHRTNSRSCLEDSLREKVVREDVVKNPEDSFVRGDAIKESSQSIDSRMKLSGWDRLPERRRGSAGVENQMYPWAEWLDSKDSMARVGRKDMQSRIEGPTPTYVLLRNDTASLQANRSNNFDGGYCREERKIGYVKSVGRGGSSLVLHGRGRGGDRRVDSSGRHWRQNHHSPSYYSSTGYVHAGSKSAAVVAAAKLESNGFVVAPDGTIVKAGSLGPGGRVRRQSVNGSPQAVHRSLTRRASPSDRGEAFGMHIGTGPSETRDPDRSFSVGRGRQVRYGPRVDGTVSRDRFNGALNGNIGSVRTVHHLARRERSCSPNQRRVVQRQSRSRSRSRSRTRSPRMWASPRGRIGNGTGFRQCSRSPPNFRYENRTNRMRSPSRRPGLGDHVMDFASTTRNRRSSPHTSRWVSERKDAADHFREHGYRQRPERSSPGRIYRRTQRFNMVDPPIRLRADEYYRPTHPGKFSEIVVGRGARYDGSDDDRRKNSDKYGMSHPGRRYDADGTSKRFRYDMEDEFTVHNVRNKDSSAFHGRGTLKDYVRSLDNRFGDAPSHAREEKGHFRNNRDGKFSVNSESFEMRHSDEEIAPRPEIPS